MTALCPGNAPSAQKPGTPLFVGASLALIDEGLLLISPWLIPFAGAIDGFVWDVVANCATDPPGFPTWTDDDWKGLASGILDPRFAAAALKIRNAMFTYLWFQYCQCAPPVVTPPMPIPPGPPPNVTIPIAGTHPCGSFDFKTSFSTLAVGTPSAALPIPAGAQFIALNAVFSPNIPAPFGVPIALGTNCYFLLADGVTFLSSIGGPNIETTVTAQEIRSVPPQARFITLNPTPASGLGTGQSVGEDLHIDFYCGPVPGQGVAGPCVPCTDPAVLNMLQYLLDLVKGLTPSNVRPPHTYVDGVARTGLTGQGSFVIGNKTTAVRVNVTTDVTGLPVKSGDPPYLFERGFIVPIAVGSAIRRSSRIAYNPQTFELPMFTDTVGWTLVPGVTATITELTPV